MDNNISSYDRCMSKGDVTLSCCCICKLLEPTTAKCTNTTNSSKIMSQSQSTDDSSVREVRANGLSVNTADVEAKLDEGNIQEAESSLREGLSLNFEVDSLRFLFFSFKTKDTVVSYFLFSAGS